MKPAVTQAIEELSAQFGGGVRFIELPDQSVSVYVDGIALGSPYAQSDTWVGFTLVPVYPYADVYPHFVRPDLSRLDGQPLQCPLHINQGFYGEPAVMVSRRTKLIGQSNPNNAALKLLKVQAWLLSL